MIFASKARSIVSKRENRNFVKNYAQIGKVLLKAANDGMEEVYVHFIPAGKQNDKKIKEIEKRLAELGYWIQGRGWVGSDPQYFIFRISWATSRYPDNKQDDWV